MYCITDTSRAPWLQSRPPACRLVGLILLFRRMLLAAIDHPTHCRRMGPICCPNCTVCPRCVARSGAPPSISAAATARTAGIRLRHLVSLRLIARAISDGHTVLPLPSAARACVNRRMSSSSCFSSVAVAPAVAAALGAGTASTAGNDEAEACGVVTRLCFLPARVSDDAACSSVPSVASGWEPSPLTCAVDESLRRFIAIEW